MHKNKNRYMLVFFVRDKTANFRRKSCLLHVGNQGNYKKKALKSNGDQNGRRHPARDGSRPGSRPYLSR